MSLQEGGKGAMRRSAAMAALLLMAPLIHHYLLAILSPVGEIKFPISFPISRNQISYQ